MTYGKVEKSPQIQLKPPNVPTAPPPPQHSGMHVSHLCIITMRTYSFIKKKKCACSNTTHTTFEEEIVSPHDILPECVWNEPVICF